MIYTLDNAKRDLDMEINRAEADSKDEENKSIEWSQGELSGLKTAAKILLPADLADERIAELESDLVDLRAENERLRCKLMPAHFVTAPEVINYLQDFTLRLDSAHERRCVEIAVLAIKRLSEDGNKTAWWQPQAESKHE